MLKGFWDFFYLHCFFGDRVNEIREPVEYAKESIFYSEISTNRTNISIFYSYSHDILRIYAQSINYEFCQTATESPKFLTFRSIETYRTQILIAHILFCYRYFERIYFVRASLHCYPENKGQYHANRKSYYVRLLCASERARKKVFHQSRQYQP